MARCVSALSVTLLLAVFEIGSALKCYQCNSMQDQTCIDPYKASGNTHLVDCSDPRSIQFVQNSLRENLPSQLLQGTIGAPRYCHKFVMMNGAVLRTCMDANPITLNQTCSTFDSLSRAMSDPAKRLAKCSVCDREACNAAGALSTSLPIAAFALLASYLYYQH